MDWVAQVFVYHICAWNTVEVYLPTGGNEMHSAWPMTYATVTPKTDLKHTFEVEPAACLVCVQKLENIFQFGGVRINSCSTLSVFLFQYYITRCCEHRVESCSQWPPGVLSSTIK